MISRCHSCHGTHCPAGKLISDAAIVAGLAGWATVTLVALAAPQPRLLSTLGVSTLAYIAGGGSIRHGDTLLVGALKEGFHRPRPSAGLSTWAFPSGHTTAATFICGVLLFVLLPAALAALQEEETQRQGKQQQGAIPAPLSSAAQHAARQLLQHRWALWGGAAALTAVGRVLDDAHWVSDIMAGALLGVALTAATAQACAGAADGGRVLVDLLRAPERPGRS